jgi:formimidoylglutamate deiminase
MYASGGPGSSTGRALIDARAGCGGAQALAQPVASDFRPALRADIVTLDTTHPSLAGRSRDAILDGWIFASGASAVACVGGRQQGRRGGRHRFRETRATH